MKNRLLTLPLLLLIVLILSAVTVHAGPLDAVKNVARDAEKALSVDSSTQAGADAAAAQGASGARPVPKKHDSHPPGYSFSTVLNGVDYLPDTGQFRLDNLQATFISNDSKGCFVLREADGRELYQYDWEVDTFRDMKPYYLLNIMGVKNLQTGETMSGGWVELKEPGDYVLDSYLPDEHFYTYPFSISKISSNDPFAEKDRWFIDGAWEDWGYFYYYNADPEKNLQFKVWLRNKTAGDRQDVKPVIEVRGPSGLVCTGRDKTITPSPDWIRYEFDMIFPPEGTSGGAYFKAKDLLKQDGAYTLTLKLGGEEYGVWEFTIKDNKFTPAGRTLRGETDPLTFIEGGRDAFWYKKQ
jgi:hypothetical protein